MDFKQIIQRALEVREKYAVLEKKKYGKEWTKEQIVQGFIGDVGDLTKLVMAKEGIRQIENVDEKLAHELTDCFWSLLVIANKYNINLEETFVKVMSDLEKRIAEET